MTIPSPTDARPTRVGVAGWSYQDWKGRVYPARPGADFDRLRWIAATFDLVEVNVTFYRVPEPRVASAWVERIADHRRFCFTVKLPRSLTHAPTQSEADVGALHRFLEPLRAAGRLDGLLAQFQWSFRPGPPALARVERLRRWFPEGDLAVEVRHGAWGRGGWMTQLRGLDVSLVSIDQPLISDSLAPLAGPGVSTIRLHGRNSADWFRKGAGRDARYNYLYSADELEAWAQRIEATPGVRVVTNNHFGGQAVANALELKARLGQPVASVPAGLAAGIPSLLPRLAAYGIVPTLDSAAAADSPQGDLFG